MSDIDVRLHADKAMRDAARRLVDADLAFVKGEVVDRSLVEQAKLDLREASFKFAEDAKDYARTHPLVVGGAILAILLLLLRNPLLDLFIGLLGDEDDDSSANNRAGEEADEKRRWTKLPTGR